MGGLFSSLTFYIIIAAVLLILYAVVFILRKKKQKQNQEIEAKTSAMIDQMSMRRAALNTQYMEKDFFNSVKSLVYSLYSQDPQYIPNQQIVPAFYMEWYNRLKREYDLGIRKQIYSFNMDKARVVKQDNSSMYAVTHITVEAEFTVDYLYSHVTEEKRVLKSFKQRFEFLNDNNSWVFEKAMNETDVKEQRVAQ